MSVVTTSAPAPAPEATALGTTDHDKAMIAKADALATGTPPVVPDAPAKPERPAHVPEKFWDAEKGVVRTEELLKSYSELEKVKPAATPAPTAAPAAADDAAAKAAEEAAKAAGADTSKVDFAALNQHYAENGQLAPEHYESLQKAGLSKEMVDAHIAGLEAQAKLATMEAHTAVGGKETFDAMLKWAGANISKAEQDAFDQAVTGSSEQRALAVAGLKAKYDAAVGTDPALVRGGGAAPAGAFQSRAEVTAAMSDPRYRKDPAYRAEVERKLAASTVF